jgi:hypothetical protein
MARPSVSDFSSCWLGSRDGPAISRKRSAIPSFSRIGRAKAVGLAVTTARV